MDGCVRRQRRRKIDITQKSYLGIVFHVRKLPNGKDNFSVEHTKSKTYVSISIM